MNCTPRDRLQEANNQARLAAEELTGDAEKQACQAAQEAAEALEVLD